MNKDNKYGLRPIAKIKFLDEDSGSVLREMEMPVADAPAIHDIVLFMDVDKVPCNLIVKARCRDFHNNVLNLVMGKP